MPPPPHLEHFRLRLGGRRQVDLPRLGDDLLDAAHEDVGDDGDAEEAVEQTEEVEGGAHLLRPCELIDYGQEEAVGALVIVQRAAVGCHDGAVLSVRWRQMKSVTSLEPSRQARPAGREREGDC